MIEQIADAVGARGAAMALGLSVGALGSWLVARRKLARARRSVSTGDARDTVVINHHVVETEVPTSADGSVGAAVAKTLRVRSLGQEELSRVVPNQFLAAELLARAIKVDRRHTLISMDGPEGSYLLETLLNFVCDRVANGTFEHDVYVMAPCCEPAGLAVHQPITILLIAVRDLAAFEIWATCKDVRVEHGMDGMRVLTLMELAKRYREEQDALATIRREGKRTRFLETMYLLDLALDKRAADVPTRPVPWERF